MPEPWLSRRITTDSPYCVGMVEMRTSMAAFFTLTLKRPSCGRRFSEMSRPDISFRRSTRAEAIFMSASVCTCMHAVDAEADHQRALLRLDVDVGGTHLGRRLENGLQQLDDRRFLQPRRERQRAQIDNPLAQFGGQFLGQAGDFLGALIDAVDGFEQLTLGDDGQFDLPLENARDFVVGEEIGRVGEADADGVVALLQHQRAEAARLGFRQQAHGGGLDVEILEVDVGRVDLPRDRLGYLLLGDETLVDENPSQFAAGFFLFAKRRLQLLFAEKLLLDEDFA